VTTGVNHITISVSDLARSLDFYTRVLGMRAVATWPVGAYLLVGGLWIALVEEKTIVRRPPEEYSHIALTVPPGLVRHCLAEDRGSGRGNLEGQYQRGGLPVLPGS
jgi:catechol 2,3-dioxygenase-like lactoylglutathione lyase family enzyme